MRFILDSFYTNDTKIRKLNLKLLYIAILNAVDGFLTFIGVSNNYTVEMNKLMVHVVSNFYSMLIIKLLLPTLILAFIAYTINKYHEVKMPVAHTFINLCFLVYLGILFIHLIWIIRVTCELLL